MVGWPDARATKRDNQECYLVLLRYRCHKCNTRQSKRVRAGLEHVPQPCPLCSWPMRVDNWRMANEIGAGARRRGLVCRCDGLSFPHRTGGSVWCKTGGPDPTGDDIIARYGYY